MEDEITDKQLNEESSIVKAVDKTLLAERIAIEVKAHLEVYSSFHP